MVHTLVDVKLWEDLKTTIRTNCDRGKESGEYVVLTTLNKSRNRLRLYDDHFERKTERSKQWQKISKEIVLEIANEAMVNGTFSIEDGELIRSYGATGCIVCTLLNLLDDFKYGEGRILSYTRNGPK
jgi:hypothetical protein